MSIPSSSRSSSPCYSPYSIRITPDVSVSDLEALEFVPSSIGLPDDFLLYSYNKLKG
jgi:hypothetical protein